MSLDPFGEKQQQQLTLVHDRGEWNYNCFVISTYVRMSKSPERTELLCNSFRRNILEHPVCL